MQHVVGSTVDSIVLLAPQAIQYSTAIVIHGWAERRVETDRRQILLRLAWREQCEVIRCWIVYTARLFVASTCLSLHRAIAFCVFARSSGRLSTLLLFMAAVSAVSTSTPTTIRDARR